MSETALAALSVSSAELEYARLTSPLRREVDKWLCAAKIVLSSKPRMAAYERAADYLNVSSHAVRAKMALFHQSHDWKVFIDNRKRPHEDAKLPQEFLEWYLITLCGGNQRKNRPAHSKLIRMWQAKEAIPGYATLPPSYARTDMPLGWSYGNLQKAVKKNPRCRFLLSLSRQGTVAASDLMPNLCLSTRVGVKPGQVYMPDDRWIDCEVVVSGQPEPCRPIELGFGDFASTKKVCFGIKPQLRLRRGGKRERTTETDMLLLYAQLFCLIGFHREGCTLICEHGTASMPVWLELELCRLSGGEVIDGKIVREGLIRTQRSGFQGGVRLMGGYLGKRLGNFKAKASYESSHNLYHNESADLPAQTGKNPDFAPEDQEKRHNEDAKLMTAMLALRPELREMVKFGRLHFNAFFQGYLAAKARIENRTAHRIQNWEECGYVIAEYRISHDPNGWRPRSELAAMPPFQRGPIEELLRNVPHLTRTRRMSPNEVWDMGQAELTVLPIHCMRLIMGEKLMDPRRVQRNGEFVIKDLGDTPMHFVAIATDDEGRETVLTPDWEYRTWHNDFQPDMLFVEAMDGRYLGICRPVPTAAPTDIAARSRAVREGEARLNAAMKPYYEQGKKLLEDRAKAIENNTAIFNGPPSPENPTAPSPPVQIDEAPTFDAL